VRKEGSAISSFHNPYNFIPAPPRRNTLLPEALASAAPPGHHRWHPDRWSGRIGVTVTTISPLLIVENDQTDPAALPVLRVPHTTGPDGVERVDIAPTQLKGMLRGLYEAVTNSCLGVVSRSHAQPHHYRSAASDASGLQPTVVAHTPTGPELRIGGTLTVSHAEPGLVSLPGAVLDAWRPTADGGRQPTQLLAGTIPGRTPLHHGQHVEAILHQRTIQVPGPGGTTRTMARWHVHDAQPIDAGTDAAPLPAPPAGRWARVTGYLHITGPTISGKRYERLFLATCPDAHPDVAFEPPAVRDAASLLTDLGRLVDDQRAAHRFARKDEIWEREHHGQARPPWEYLGHEPGKTAWARHLYQAADASSDVTVPPWLGPDLAPHTPPPAGSTARYTCWAETGDASPIGPVKRLRPVMISRMAYPRPPLDLLDETLRPATALDALSPADRVFGWVNQQADDGNPSAGDPDTARPERRAYQGQLRVAAVTGPPADAIETMPQPVVLPILATPKPTQGRFYLGRSRPTGVPDQLPSGTVRAGYFQPGQVWRGRKIYLYQRRRPGLSTVSPGHSRSTPSGIAYLDDPGTQSAWLHDWIRPGSTITFDLIVDNLTGTELGALLWLLDPDRLGTPTTTPPRRGRMRLGLGKPYGFGVVETQLDPTRTRLATGAAIAERFTTLGGERPDDPAWADLAANFTALAETSLPATVAAIRAAATGVPGPVHYPSQNGPGQGNGYDWFVENERAAERRAKADRAGRTGHGRNRHQPVPRDDRSLPLLHGKDRTALDPITETQL